GSGSKADNCATADDWGAETPHEGNCLFYRIATPNDVIHDDARIDLALIHVLAKHALPSLLFGPVNLFGAEGLPHTESDRNSAGTGTDDGDLRQLAGNIAIDAELAAESDRQNARSVIVAKGQRHLKIVRRVLAVRINEVTFAKCSRAF